jgi:sugar/nucleoside kinase (ribokinase family)
VTSDVFMSAARGATMLFANEEEATTLSGVGNVDDAIGEIGLVFSEVMVTRGADGALARVNGSTTHAPSLSRDALDTTGAGDAATGAYLAARLKGHDVGVALRAAMEASAAVVKGLGSRG